MIVNYPFRLSWITGDDDPLYTEISHEDHTWIVYGDTHMYGDIQMYFAAHMSCGGLHGVS